MSGCDIKFMPQKSNNTWIEEQMKNARSRRQTAINTRLV